MELNFKIESLVEKLNSKKHREVIEEANELIKKYPNIFVFYNIIGLAYQGISNLEEAKIFFLKAIEKNPNEIGPKNNLANIYVSLGKLDEAEKLFVEILNKVKKSPVIYINYAHLKKKINDYKSALQLVERAINIDENNLEYYEELANIYQLRPNPSLTPLENAIQYINMIYRDYIYDTTYPSLYEAIKVLDNNAMVGTIATAASIATELY